MPASTRDATFPAKMAAALTPHGAEPTKPTGAYPDTVQQSLKRRDALFGRFWASLKQRTAGRPTQPQTVNGTTKSRGECRPTQSPVRTEAQATPNTGSAGPRVKTPQRRTHRINRNRRKHHFRTKTLCLSPPRKVTGTTSQICPTVTAAATGWKEAPYCTLSTAVLRCLTLCTKRLQRAPQQHPARLQEAKRHGTGTIMARNSPSEPLSGVG
ncbi:Hypothetical predicted protein [Pelobates cultripes]|uniref:Uncharacterized protein n=1 Tax=Pelobates cultripes TaxID=61616 RepID=A0AAD1S4F5_PELCU|nr:Hypothetical predicted protein [Pelobates cultripes]